MTPTISALGDNGMRISFGETFSIEGHEKAREIFEHLHDLSLPNVHDIVLSWVTVAVYCHPWCDAASVRATVIDAVRSATQPNAAHNKPNRRLWRVPVDYGGSSGPDLKKVAEFHGCTEEEIIRLHTAQAFQVYFLGFSPGFPYLRMPTALQTPKLAHPRPRIAPGSIWIGGEVGGIYTIPTPGGGQLIGHTSFELFDEGMPRIRPGDRILFYDQNRCPTSWEGTSW